jgi:hypothetical protein
MQYLVFISFRVFNRRCWLLALLTLLAIASENITSKTNPLQKLLDIGLKLWDDVVIFKSNSATMTNA